MIVAVTAAAGADAQFLDTFDDRELSIDSSGVEGWSFFTGDGKATMDFRATGEGHATIVIDATEDERNIWWALIKHKVSGDMDLGLLGRPDRELRVEARIRTSHAPRRVNLHLNTQRTTDFHSHLKEFDIAEAEIWHTISMTTRDFPVAPGDTVFAQMALMDWGLGRCRVDVDYFKVDVVEADAVGPDLGEPLPYHPPIPDPDTFAHVMPATESAVVDLAHGDANLGEWSVLDGSVRKELLTVNGTLWVILRWDLAAFAGRRAAGHGLLELTTHSVERNAVETKDFGLVRVVEILGGDPSWCRTTATFNDLLRRQGSEEVFNPQLIIDWPVTEGEGGKTLFTISRPVLQRLIDGRTLGLAIRPSGSINASFSAREGEKPQLLFNTEE